MAIKAADMLIARRADTRARADFATWKMLAKLNGASALPAEAQNFLVSYRQLLEKMTERMRPKPPSSSCTRPTTPRWAAPERRRKSRARSAEPAPDTGNVTAFRRPPPSRRPRHRPAPTTKPRLPVALIFVCLAVVYVGIRYYWR